MAVVRVSSKGGTMSLRWNSRSTLCRSRRPQHGHRSTKIFLQGLYSGISTQPTKTLKSTDVDDELYPRQWWPPPFSNQAPNPTKPCPHRANEPGYGRRRFWVGWRKGAANQTIPLQGVLNIVDGGSSTRTGWTEKMKEHAGRRVDNIEICSI